MRPPRVPPAFLSAGAALAQHLLTRRRAPTPASLVACAPVVGISGWLLAGSLTEFRRRTTTVNPVALANTRVLVVAGPNRVTRNPMYLGMAGLLTAHAIGRRSPLALVPMAGFVWWIDRGQIPAEEGALLDAFGHEFERYRAQVPRWVI